MVFILRSFLSNRSQHVMVDGCRSIQINVVGCVVGQCFGPYCSSCTPLSLFPFWTISLSVIPMTRLCYLMCQPQAVQQNS